MGQALLGWSTAGAVLGWISPAAESQEETTPGFAGSVKTALSFPSHFPGGASRALERLLRDARAHQAAGAPPEHEFCCQDQSMELLQLLAHAQCGIALGIHTRLSLSAVGSE